MRPAEKTISPLYKASLIHTDAWIGNFIGDKERLVLIDWQCPGLGDPAEDIWTFLYSGYQQLIGLPVYTRAEQQAFLDAYNNSDVFERLEQLSPYFAYRVAAHAVMRIQDLETTNPEGSSAYKIVLASLREHLNHD